MIDSYYKNKQSNRMEFNSAQKSERKKVKKHPDMIIFHTYYNDKFDLRLSQKT